jgi:hypothetical protein
MSVLCCKISHLNCKGRLVACISKVFILKDTVRVSDNAVVSTIRVKVSLFFNFFYPFLSFFGFLVINLFFIIFLFPFTYFFLF